MLCLGATKKLQCNKKYKFCKANGCTSGVSSSTSNSTPEPWNPRKLKWTWKFDDDTDHYLWVVCECVGCYYCILLFVNSVILTRYSSIVVIMFHHCYYSNIDIASKYKSSVTCTSSQVSTPTPTHAKPDICIATRRLRCFTKGRFSKGKETSHQAKPPQLGRCRAASRSISI